MMPGKLLFVASTQSHILTFHLPYLRTFQENGWTIHGAWGGATGEVPYVDKILPLPFEKKMTALGNFRATLLLRKAIKKEGYDVVIVHTSLAAFFTRLAILGVRRRPQTINMVHGYLFDDQISFLKRTVLLAAERLTAPVTDLLLTMNQWDYNTANKYHLGKTIVNVPGIGVNFPRLDEQRMGISNNLRQSLNIPASAFVLLYPAEFSPRKSQHILLKALSILPPHVVLVLPGSGALLDECRDLAQTLNVADRVYFPGYITEMGAWYEMADAAISSSRSEGLPFNIMEAMHMGLPVIASAVKGHVDLIQDGKSGLLYPYGNWEACANRVSCLLSDPEFAHSLARQAHEDVMQYALAQVLPQVMAQYESILKTPVAK